MIAVKNGFDAIWAAIKDCTLYSTKNHLKVEGFYEITLNDAASGTVPPTVTHYKDIEHNLGYKPLVEAYAYFNYPGSTGGLVGWRVVPATYWYAGDFGILELVVVYMEHIDNNTIRFYGQSGLNVKVRIYLEPREDAWYE